MQLAIQSPASGSRTLWVWTTLLLLLAVTLTTTPGGGLVQAAESPQQQPRDLSLLNRIEALLDELLVKLDSLLNYVTPTITTPSATSITATTPDGGTTTGRTTSGSTETTTPGSTVTDGTATDTSISSSIETATPESSSSVATSTDISTSENTDTATSESSSSVATSTDTSTSESTDTATPGSSSSVPTPTDTSTSENTDTATPGSSSSVATSTDTSTSENTDTATPGSSSSVATSTDTSTSESTETATPGSSSSVATSTDTSTSENTDTATPGTSSSVATSTDTSTSESTETATNIYIAKRSLAISRKLLTDEGCTSEGDTDYCTKLIQVLDTIADVTGKLEDGEVSQDMVTQLENANSEMDDILDHREDIELHDDIKETIESTIEDVKEAKVIVQESIDDQNKNSQTLVIVLGSVGGFIVVALVATLIFAYYKKRKTSIDDKQKLNTEYVPINSFKEDGQDNPNFYPEVVTAQRPAQPQEVQTYGTSSHLQPKKSQAKDNSNSAQNYYETPSYSMADDVDSQNVPNRTSYRGGYVTETQGQQPTYSRPPAAAADKVPRPTFYGNTNKQPPRPASGASYDTTDHRSPSRPTSKTAYDYGRKPNRSGYENDVRVPRVAPKPQTSRPYSPPGRSYDKEANDPYSLDARGNVKRLAGTPAGGLRRIDN